MRNRMTPEIEEVLWWVKQLLRDAANGDEVSPWDVLRWVQDLEELLVGEVGK